MKTALGYTATGLGCGMDTQDDFMYNYSYHTMNTNELMIYIPRDNLTFIQAYMHTTNIDQFGQCRFTKEMGGIISSADEQTEKQSDPSPQDPRPSPHLHPDQTPPMALHAPPARQ
jgi:hypothetical protein